MLLSTLITLLSLNFYAYSQVDDVPKAKSFRDIEHQTPGCPINSICNKESGKLVKSFEDILKIKNSSSRYKKLKEFSKKSGLPIQVLTNKEHGEINNVILWNSRCKQHNPKNPNNTIYQGHYFTKSIPKKSELTFDKIHLFLKDKLITYKVAYKDKPLFIKGDRLFILKDYDDHLYQLSIGANGDFKVENLNSNLYAKAQSRKIKEVPCPENKQDIPDLYAESYCQKIWDIDTNTLKTIQVFWSCP